MTKAEAKQYALQILKDGGVSDEDATRITSAFDNDKFFNGFVPRPEVDRALSSEQQKYTTYKQRNEYLEKEWFPSAKRNEESARAILTKFQKYQELYGEIDETDPAAVRRAATATGLTREQVDEMLQNSLASRDRATLDLMEIREDYMDRFKKRLPMKEFEKHVEEARRNGSNDSVSALYRDWIAPELDKQTPHRFSEEELKARDKRIREEAEKDLASRRSTPTDTRRREPHLLLDAARLKADREKANGSAKSGREAFLEVIEDPHPETVRDRYPVA